MNEYVQKVIWLLANVTAAAEKERLFDCHGREIAAILTLTAAPWQEAYAPCILES